jgi:hypothetical protein
LAKAPEDRPSDAEAITEILIDGCRASMFHLPVASDPRIARPEGSNILLCAPLSGTYAANESTRDLISESRTTGEISSCASIELHGTSSSSRRALTMVGVHPPQRMSWWMVIGAATAVLVGGVLAYSVTKAAREEDAVVVAVEGVSANNAHLDAALARADDLITRQAFDAAEAELTHLESALAGDDGRHLTLTRLRKRARIGSLLAGANQHEAANRLEDARVIYEEILELDAAHIAARDRLSTLLKRRRERAEIAALGVVDVISTPVGELFLDGAPVGITPYHGRLSRGEHRLRVVATGHEEWMGTVEVVRDGQAPVEIQLKRTRIRRRGTRRASSSRKTTKRAPTTTRDDTWISENSEDHGTFLPVGTVKSP